MPTPPKNLNNMRKHLTPAERAARQKAEEKLSRGKRVYLRAPAWLSQDGKSIFNSMKGKMRGLNILDPVDQETLALYADAVARYREMVSRTNAEGERVALDLKEQQAAQAWSRLALQYAEKMGISPTARARLAKKQAEREPMDALEQLLNDVSDYVNEERD